MSKELDAYIALIKVFKKLNEEQIFGYKEYKIKFGDKTQTYSTKTMGRLEKHINNIQLVLLKQFVENKLTPPQKHRLTGYFAYWNDKPLDLYVHDTDEDTR